MTVSTRSSPARPTRKDGRSPSAPPTGIRTATAATSCTGWRSRSGRRSDGCGGGAGALTAGLRPAALCPREDGFQRRAGAASERDPVDEAGQLRLVGGGGAAEPALEAELAFRVREAKGLTGLLALGRQGQGRGFDGAELRRHRPALT